MVTIVSVEIGTKSHQLTGINLADIRKRHGIALRTVALKARKEGEC